VTTQRAIDERPGVVAAAIRAVVRAQRALKGRSSLAAIAAEKTFPAAELALIPELNRATRRTTIRRFQETVDSSMPFHGRAGSVRGRLTNASSRRSFKSLWK